MWPALLVLVAAAAFGVAPLAVLVCICLLATMLPGRGALWLFVGSACLLFVLMNLAKELEGDLITYAELQRAIAGQPFEILFRSQELQRVSGTYRVTELGFYAGLWSLGGVWGANSAVIPVASSLVIYLCSTAGALRWGRSAGWNQRLTLVVLLVGVFAAVNFVQTTHLLRQYLAGSIAFLALAHLATGRRVSAAMLGLSACSIHNSALLVVVGFALPWLLFLRSAGPYRWPGVLWRCVLIALVVGGLLVFLGIRDQASMGREEGNLSLFHFAFALGLLGAALFARRRSGYEAAHFRLLLLAYGTILAISAAYFVVGFSLLALRYFAYLEWLYALLVAELLCMVPRRHTSAYLLSRWGVCAVATCTLVLRIDASGWAYGGGGASIFVASAPEVAAYLGR